MEFNFSKIEKIANETNGKAYHLRDEESLQKSFKEAALENISVKLDSEFIILILVAIISISELFIYSKVGGI